MLKDDSLSDSWRLSNFDKAEFDKLKEKLQLPDLCIKILMASGIDSHTKDLDLFLESSEDLLFSYDQLLDKMVLYLLSME